MLSKCTIVRIGGMWTTMLAVVLLSACYPRKVQWSMFRHDVEHTGLSPFDTSADRGTQKWKFDAGGEMFSSPAIGPDGIIYTGSWDHNLYAINPDGQ
jgi:hypothetical protein